MNLLTAAMSWVRQPSTLMCLGCVIGAGVYYFTGNPTLALVAAGLVPGAVNDKTAGILTRIEAVETALKPTK